LPTTSTDEGSLPILSSSHSDAAIATPPLTRHSSHSFHHSFSHAHTLSYYPIPSFANRPTHSFLDPPAAALPTGLTSPHDFPHTNPPSSLAHKSFNVIMFASIGGIIALALLALCARRVIAHIRTPRHAAVLTAVERAQLEREIAEYTVSATRRQCHSLIGPPPPPYEHAPSYDSLVTHQSS